MGELVEFLTQNGEGFRRNRLPALYSDFRGMRATNPDGYAANVSAWRRALASIARSGLATSSSAASPDLLTLTTDEGLLRALESKQYGRPLALGAVIHEAVAERDLIPLVHFLGAKQNIYRTGSSWTSLPWAVVSWGLRQTGLTGVLGPSTDKLPTARFVVLANVEAAARSFAQRTAGMTSRLQRTWSKTHFVRTFADTILPTQRLSDSDVDVLLTFLSRDKGVVAYDGDVVKIKDGRADSTTEITSEDVAIAQLRELTASLTHQTALLNRRVDELVATAKEAVAKKNKVAALAALRSKKQAEASLQARFASLSQLEEVALRIEQATDQVQLVKVMASSTDALRSLNAAVGGADRVGEVVDRLREQMGAADEVGSILAESAITGGPEGVLDEGEIDEELAMLERQEREKAEAAERASKEAADIRQAEDTKRRLEAVEAPKNAPLVSSQTDAAEKATEAGASEKDSNRRLAGATGEDAAEDETVRLIRRMSLLEQPEA